MIDLRSDLTLFDLDIKGRGGLMPPNCDTNVQIYF